MWDALGNATSYGGSGCYVRDACLSGQHCTPPLRCSQSMRNCYICCLLIWSHVCSIHCCQYVWSHTRACVVSRVVHGDINFGILRDPLNFLFPMDPNRPYWTNFLIENGSFLLTKAHVFGANWPSDRQLQRPFGAICHCEKGSEMCLELTTSLWGFQKWCEKVESDQKWPSYGALKITNFQKSE